MICGGIWILNYPVTSFDVLSCFGTKVVFLLGYKNKVITAKNTLARIFTSVEALVVILVIRGIRLNKKKRETQGKWLYKTVNSFSLHFRLQLKRQTKQKKMKETRTEWGPVSGGGRNNWHQHNPLILKNRK